MADIETNNPEFEIVVNLVGGEQSLNVKPEETSDGVPYYSLYSGGSQLTQIRKDEDGNWEQMWGELQQKDIDAIGKVITEKEL